MKNFISMLAFAAIVTSFVACDNDDDSKPGAPTITAPASTSVQVNNSTDVTFQVTTPGGFKSYEVSATGGSAVKKSSPDAGAKNGNVVVTFTADAAVGDGSVSITVTDNNEKTSTESATVTKTAKPETEIVTVQGLIEANTTWENDKIYVLDGRVIVTNGKTLTIEPGTIIKGETGTGALASALIISRGAMIMAEGTADAPIIFTSVDDDLDYDSESKVGTTLDQLDNAKWGGLIILGKANVSAKSGDTESSIEGIPADEQYGLYGGNVNDDNSGVLKYVSIRHGGSLIGEGNEINGLTLGGVGSGTTIENVEIFATLDDGVELFGGTVNVKNLLVYWQGDDGVDIDQNYAGTITNFVVYQGEGVGTDEGLEIDGPEGTTYTTGKFTLKDGTIVSDGVEGSAADIKADAQGTLNNIVWSGYSSAKIKFEGEYTAGDCSDHSTKTYHDALQNFLNGDFVIMGSMFNAISVYSKADANGNPLCTSISDVDKNAASAKATSDANATGADASVFGWTAASALDLL